MWGIQHLPHHEQNAWEPMEVLHTWSPLRAGITQAGESSPLEICPHGRQHWLAALW